MPGMEGAAFFISRQVKGTDLKGGGRMAKIIQLSESKTRSELKKKEYHGKDVKVFPAKCECKGFPEVWRWKGSQHERVLLNDLKKDFETPDDLAKYLKSLPLVII
jgi:hypothetical protein